MFTLNSGCITISLANKIKYYKKYIEYRSFINIQNTKQGIDKESLKM